LSECEEVNEMKVTEAAVLNGSGIAATSVTNDMLRHGSMLSFICDKSGSAQWSGIAATSVTIDLLQHGSTHHYTG